MPEADGEFDLGARNANVSELAIAHRPQLSDGRLVQAPARVAHPPTVCRCPQRRRNMRMGTFVAGCRAREWSAHDDLLSVFLCCHAADDGYRPAWMACMWGETVGATVGGTVGAGVESWLRHAKARFCDPGRWAVSSVAAGPLGVAMARMVRSPRLLLAGGRRHDANANLSGLTAGASRRRFAMGTCHKPAHCVSAACWRSLDADSALDCRRIPD